MVSFNKRVPGGVLPAQLADSALLTTGLQQAIRSQRIVTLMTVVGMALGAALAAWLVAFAPEAWGAYTFTGPGAGTVTALNWIGRVLGVVMGSVVIGGVFRHVTYTAVAKSLLGVQKQADITELEHTWLAFELASMYRNLDKSDWTNPSVFAEVFALLLWLGVAFFAGTGSMTFTADTRMVSVQFFVFIAIFLTGWRYVFRAPEAMNDLDYEGVEEKLKTQLNTQEPLLAVVTYAKPYVGYINALIICCVLAIVVGGSARALDNSVKRQARTDTVAASVRKASVDLRTVAESPRAKVLATLAQSQYSGELLNWAIFAEFPGHLFHRDACVNLNNYGMSIENPHAQTYPVLCSIGGDSTLDLFKELLIQEQLTELEWAQFRYVKPVLPD